MSNLNFLLVLNSYSDSNPSNYPSRNNFRWTRALNAFPVLTPVSEAITLAPGETRVLFSGTRTLSQDNTTEYSIAPYLLSNSIFVLSNSGGTAPNFRTPRSTGADASTQVNVTQNGPLAIFSSVAGSSAVSAEFVGELPGMTTSVTIVALTPGSAGNSIVVPVDGISSVNQLVSNWNVANSGEQIQVQAGDDSQIPTSGSFTFSGGMDGITPFNLSGCQVGDNVIIGDQFNTLNQGQYTIIALTPTSFTLNNPTAASEGPITLGSDFANQIKIFSAAGVQVGDIVKISGGFSSVSQGSYEITQVSANSLQFSSLQNLPTEGPINTQAIAVYSEAKQLVYVESDQNCVLTINGVATDAIEPFVADSFTSPGIFLRKSTIYSLSVTNSSIYPANLFMASCE